MDDERWLWRIDELRRHRVEGAPEQDLILRPIGVDLWMPYCRLSYEFGTRATVLGPLVLERYHRSARPSDRFWVAEARPELRAVLRPGLYVRPLPGQRTRFRHWVEASKRQVELDSRILRSLHEHPGQSVLLELRSRYRWAQFDDLLCSAASESGLEDLLGEREALRTELKACEAGMTDAGWFPNYPYAYPYEAELPPEPVPSPGWWSRLLPGRNKLAKVSSKANPTLWDVGQDFHL